MKHSNPAEDGTKNSQTAKSHGGLHLWRWPLACVLIAWAAVVGVALVLQTPIEVRLSNEQPIVVTLDGDQPIRVQVEDHGVTVKEDVKVIIEGGHLDADANVDSSL